MDAEEWQQYNRAAYERFIIQYVGVHYLENFDARRIRQKQALDKLIAAMLKTRKGIILTGNVGVGKTMDLVYIIRRIVENAQGWFNIGEIRYFFAPDLFTVLHEGQQVILGHTRYFFIDDVGREYIEPFALSQFEALIEKIYSANITLVITTNLTVAQLVQREGWERIIDRMRETCNVLKIAGNSMRHK